jgi:predicted nucleic acid-binding protein
MLPNTYNEPVAGQLADLLTAARAVGPAEAMGAIIAAIALAYNLSVWTEDGAFDVLVELAPVLRG